VDAQIEVARRALAASEADVNRLLETEKSSAGSEQWLPRARLEQDRARALLAEAQARKAMMTITAPMAGTVAELLISPGEVANPAWLAMKIIDFDRLTVAVSVPGPQLRTLSVGQEAEIVDRAAPAASNLSTQPTTEPESPSDASTTQPPELQGKIVFIDPLIDPKTGLGQAFVSLPPGSGLRPGQFVSVRIITRTEVDALTAPAGSIVRNAMGEPGISVVVRDFQWAFRHPVRIGIEEGDWVEIEGPGLKAGDNVVTTGAFALPDQSRISVSR
jgi:RND family efflux transporter MFP subunit